MTRFPALSILFLLAVAASSGVNAQTLRIATFNVNYDNTATCKIVDVIRSSKADVVCIQETSRRSFAALRERLAHDYPHRETVGEFSFASRHELKELQYHEFARGWYSATINIGQRRIRIINVHLCPVIVPDNPTLVGVLKALKEQDDGSRGELHRVLKNVDRSFPTVIVGDFNSLSLAKAPSLMRDSGFIDSYAAVHQNADSDGTWNWQMMRELEPGFTKERLNFTGFARNIPFSLRTDYIFHSNHFRTLSSTIIPDGGSDHYLVVSELKIDEQSVRHGAAVNANSD